jgi:putative ABC transport system substrate-binding protein
MVGVWKNIHFEEDGKMVGKKKIALLLCGLLFGTSLVGCTSKNETSIAEKGGNSSKVYTIGINQLVQHGALDAAKEGFIEGLKEKGYEEGENVRFDYQNAQGDVSIAQTISQQFVNGKVDMIFAIATPAVQAAYNATKDIPIVFTAVTDPVAAEVAND